MEDTPFPRVPLDLLQELEARFPDRCPDLSVSERELWAASGAVGVIRLLRREWAHQNDNPLDKVT